MELQSVKTKKTTLDYTIIRVYETNVKKIYQMQVAEIMMKTRLLGDHAATLEITSATVQINIGTGSKVACNLF